MTQVYKTAAAGVARQAVPRATTYAREMSAPQAASAGHTVAQMSVFPRDLRPASQGRPLPAPVAQKMQSFFGQDLSTVRVHEDSHSASIHARAFTRGENLHFAPGEYQPHTLSGQRLLGHELSHVLQQRAGRVAVPSGVGTPINSSPTLESEADRTGTRAARYTPKTPVQTLQVTGGQAVGKWAMRGLRDSCITIPVQTASKKESNTKKSTELLEQPTHKQSTNEESAENSTQENSLVVIKRERLHYQTIKDIPIKHGEHRRHIISSHVMLKAIQSFLRQPDIKGKESAAWNKFWGKYKSAQNLHNLLNNYRPNLIPGPGPENTAIGMITNKTERELNSGVYDKGTAKEHQARLITTTGFQKKTQKELLDGIKNVFLKDSILKMSAKKRKQFVKDLVDSTDFDWPENPDPELFGPWSEVYMRFKDMNANPQKFTAEQFVQLIHDFFSLPRPVAMRKSRAPRASLKKTGRT